MDRTSENQLGNRIAELRREAGLTQEQLAGMLGVTYQAVSKWETGNSYPDISLLPRLSEIFHVSLDSLFGKDDNAILTERVLEKAVEAASKEDTSMGASKEDTSKEEASMEDVSKEENPSAESEAGKKRLEKEESAESDPAQSFGEYIGNIVNMSLKSGMNGLGKAMDTLKKIDFKSLDLRELDQSISEKVKRAVEKGKKSHFFSARGENGDREESGREEEERAEDKAGCESEEDKSQTAGDEAADSGEAFDAERAEDVRERCYREMERWGEGKNAAVSWEDDGKIRVAVYVGKTMLRAEEYRSMKGRITLEVEGECRDVITYANVSCENVEGSIKAGGSVSCDQVHGNVGAGTQVSCDSVRGSVFAGESVSCDHVNGDVVAGGNVECDTVNRNVTAGGHVECDEIHGNVTASHVERE